MVSEILDCDNKALPDVIPAIVSNTPSQPNQHCDITANLLPVDMDTTEDSEKDVSVNLESTTEESGSSPTESSDDQMIHTDLGKSVEEKRAEFYAEIKESPVEGNSDCEKQSESETSSTKDSSSVEENSNHNNASSESSTSNDDENVVESTVETPKDNEMRIPCESSEESGEDNTVTSSVEPESKVTETEHAHIHLDSSSDFNTFQYWRTPIPQVDLELLNEPKASSVDTKSDNSSDDTVNVYDGTNGLTLGLSDSLNDLTVCDNKATSVMLGSSEAVEHDLQGTGQGETTMTVIDGVVQGIILMVLSSIFSYVAISCFYWFYYFT